MHVGTYGRVEVRGNLSSEFSLETGSPVATFCVNWIGWYRELLRMILSLCLCRKSGIPIVHYLIQISLGYGNPNSGPLAYTEALVLAYGSRKSKGVFVALLGNISTESFR